MELGRVKRNEFLEVYLARVLGMICMCLTCLKLRTFNAVHDVTFMISPLFRVCGNYIYDEERLAK